MQTEIITIYVICDDYLKEHGFRDDWQAEISTAEVTCIALVAAHFFKNCLKHSRVFMCEERYIRTSISESRLN